jgi:MFS family permease
MTGARTTAPGWEPFRGAPPAAAGAPPDGRPRLGWILGLTSTAYFMVVLDALVVVTALPQMQRDLHVGLSSLQWTVNAYCITFAAGIITAAALGDRLGRRRVFVYGLGLFTLASAACALSPHASLLIAARAVQGFGGAMVLPLSLTILTTAFPVERRGSIIGIYGGLAGLAVAAGPVVGGAVTQGLDSHWIFWINVPIGVVASLLSARLLPETFGPPARLDLPGVALVSAGAVSVVWGLVRANQAGWGSAEIITTLTLGVVLVGAFVFWESRAPEPMVPLRLFRIGAFAAGNATAFLMSGALSDRIGRRPVIATGLLLQSAGFAWLAVSASARESYVEIVTALLVAGIGISMALPTVPTAVLNAVAPDEMGTASGINYMMQRFGAVVAVAIASSVFAASGHLGSPAGVTAGFKPALAVCAALSLLGAFTALAIAPWRRGTVADRAPAAATITP